MHRGLSLINLHSAHFHCQGYCMGPYSCLKNVVSTTVCAQRAAWGGLPMFVYGPMQLCKKCCQPYCVDQVAAWGVLQFIFYEPRMLSTALQAILHWPRELPKEFSWSFCMGGSSCLRYVPNIHWYPNNIMYNIHWWLFVFRSVSSAYDETCAYKVKQSKSNQLNCHQYGSALFRQLPGPIQEFWQHF